MRKVFQDYIDSKGSHAKYLQKKYEDELNDGGTSVNIPEVIERGMTAGELLEYLNRQTSLPNWKRYKDYKIVIQNSIPSQGGRAYVNVISLSPEGDWDGGKMFVVPEYKMIKKED